MNRHQRGNKGFGPALGPDAARGSGDRFKRVGYTFVDGPSDWVFGPTDRDIQSECWADLLKRHLNCETCRRRRCGLARAPGAMVAEGRSTMRLGHVDFFALPLPIR